MGQCFGKSTKKSRMRTSKSNAQKDKKSILDRLDGEFNSYLDLTCSCAYSSKRSRLYYVLASNINNIMTAIIRSLYILPQPFSNS